MKISNFSAIAESTIQYFRINRKLYRDKFQIKPLEYGLILLEAVLLFVFIYFHYKIGITRYFDADEMAHLHWAFNFYSGLRPYQDFLYFFPPGYLFFLWPLVFFFGKSLAVLTAARFLAFLVFGLLLGALFMVVREVRNVKTALLTVVILSFLPLPFDKFLEVRPDNLAAALTFWGMYFFVRAVKGKKGFLAAGLFYALGMAVLPKVIFYILPLLSVLIWRFIFISRRKKAYRNLFIGAVIPIIGVLLAFIFFGNFSRAVYLATSFASQSAKILGYKFPMHASHFFFPIDAYYGYGGYNGPLVLNEIIYALGILWSAFMLISFLDKGRKEDSLTELLLSFSCYFNFYAYLDIFPLKHAQYLIVVAPLVTFYFSDFILKIGDKLERIKFGAVLKSVLLGGFLCLVGYYGIRMNGIKLNWTNNSTVNNIKRLETVIPKDEYVLDMAGEAFMYKDPYYICCIPYGQYIEAFRFRVPSLGNALEKNQVKYVYLQNEGRLDVMAYEHQKYIKEHYILVTSDPAIMIAGFKIKLEKSEATADLVSSGNYRIFWNDKTFDPGENAVTIDGERVKSDLIFLTNGQHNVKSETAGQLTIQYQPK